MIHPKKVLLFSLLLFSLNSYSQAPTVTNGCYLDSGLAFYTRQTTTSAGTSPNNGFVWDTLLPLNNTQSCPRVATPSGGTQTSTICYGPESLGSLAVRRGRVYTGVRINNCPIDDYIPILYVVAGGLAFLSIRSAYS